MAKNYIFERTEKKYLLSACELDAFFKTIKNNIKMDEYGKYPVFNLYLDTQDSYLIRNSLEKPAYKEKIRLRSYGNVTPQESVFLELKKKYQGVVYKRRIELPYEQASDYINKGIHPNSKGQIFNEIDYFMGFYHVKPKLFLAYDRIAFKGRQDPELRITIDKNIRSRWDHLTLQKSEAPTTLLSPNAYLMEIKAVGAMPLWLTQALAMAQIYPTSFSKYGEIYKTQFLRSTTSCFRVS